MKRNQREEEWRRLRRLAKRLGDLPPVRHGWNDRYLDWVPVDEPQFIGWEVTVELSEQRKRSRDAEDLQAVIDMLNISRPVFTRYARVPKLVKEHKGRYDDVLRVVTKLIRRHFYWHSYDWVLRYDKYIPYFYNNYISEQQYRALEPSVRRYFGGSTIGATRWREAYKIYQLDTQAFPMYELVIKSKRAYSTHRGVPKNDELVEAAEIDATLERALYWRRSNRYHRSNYEAYHHHQTNVTVRKRWKTGLREVAKHAPSVFSTWFRDDENPLPDIVEQAEKHICARIR